MTCARLHAIEAGPPSEPPLVLLHGFGGHGQSWQPVIDLLGNQNRIIAFDLPGHGGSLEYPGFGSPRFAAVAILAEIQQRGIAKFHLAGHSMGGAIAVLMALEAPETLLSLTLAAPGGFGPEMHQAALRSFANATSAAHIADALKPMMVTQPAAAMLQSLATVHVAPGQSAALLHILTKICRGDGQGVLPLAELARDKFPAHLIWGTDDRIVPITHADNAPDWFTVERIEGAGHMLLDEAPQTLACAVLNQTRTTRQTI